MKRRIDPVAINNVGEYLSIQVDALRTIQQKLLADIESISNVYEGIDATNIITKYKERAQYLELIITNYENQSKYMKTLAQSYSDNLMQTKKKFMEFNLSDNKEISNQTFSDFLLAKSSLNQENEK